MCLIAKFFLRPLWLQVKSNDCSLFDNLRFILSWTDLVSPTTSSSSSILNDFQSVLSNNNSLKSYSLFDYPTTTTASALDASWRNFRDMSSTRTAENIRAIFDTPAERGPPPSLFRSVPPTSPPGGLDIWGTNGHQLNGFVGSPPITGPTESKSHSMVNCCCNP